MGVFGGPNLSEDGLVFALDAGNTKGFDDDENLMTNSQLGTTILNDGSGVTLTTDTTIVNPFEAYDGVLKCVHTTNVGGYFRRGQLISLTAEDIYTFSLFFKNETVSNPYGQNTNSGPALLYVAGVGSGTGPTFDSGAVSLNTNIPYPNGWYKQVYTFTPAYTQAYHIVFNQTVNQSLIGTYYLYGFQLERGSSASPYYATTSTAKNRGTTLIDMTGGGNTGTLTNGPTYSSANGGSIVFDGTNDKVTFPNNTISTTAGITVDVWFKTSSGTKYQDIFDLDDSFGVWITTNYNSPGKITASFDTTGGIMSADYVANNWYQVVISGSGTSNTLYVNGVSVATASQTVATSINLNTARIGNVDGDRASEYLIGNVASLKLYNRALTAAEISQNFNALRGRFGI